jgi:hypothetical protein
MRDRCRNPNSSHYRYYGGRGITVCTRWSKFRSFVEDMGLRPDGMTLDRIDVNGDYDPSNCRWASKEEQARNSNQCIYLERNGVRMTVAEWTRLVGLSHAAIYNRLRKGVPTWRVLDIYSEVIDRLLVQNHTHPARLIPTHLLPVMPKKPLAEES